MRNEAVEVVRQFLESVKRGYKIDQLVAFDAVFVDLSPSGGALRLQGELNIFVGRSQFIEASTELLQKANRGELAVDSLFGCGGNVAGFGMMTRVLGDDPAEFNSPVSLWAKVAGCRIRFFQFLEFVPPTNVPSTVEALSRPPMLALDASHEPLRLLTFQP